MTDTVSKLGDNATAMLDSATQSADQAIRNTQRVANHALDQMASGVEHARDQAGSAFNRLAMDADRLTQRGLDAVRDGTQHLREQSRHAAQSTVGYIKDEPVKSVLMAAAVGAALMALVTLVRNSGGSRH